MHFVRRFLLSAAVATLGAATAVFGSAPPAQAMTSTSAPLKAWTYTDSAQPSTPVLNPGGGAPIGSSRDAAGLKHTQRAYYTFDIAAFKKQILHQANFASVETSVVDCSKTAPIEVWRTKPVTSTTTWQKPPKELELLAERSRGAGTICPGAYLGVDMIAAIQAAYSRGESTITFEVRVAAAVESDPQLGRTMRQFSLYLSTNHAPTVSDLTLTNPARSCGSPQQHPTAGGQTTFTAKVTDLDPADHPQGYFAVWPVEHPDQRAEFGGNSAYQGTIQAQKDLHSYADGTVLAWSAQGRDYDDSGPWGKTCYLTIDNTAPATVPAVSSKIYNSDDYPGTGGPGVPGTFVFDALGDHDVVSFQYFPSDGSGQTAIANHPGGKAKVSITPRRWGSASIRVRSVDAAGNFGAFRTYDYEVRNTAPFATVDVAGVGLTSHITMTSAASEVTSFGYAIDGGAETRVPVVDGKGTGEIVFTSKGWPTITERSYAGQKMIGSYDQQVEVSDAPGIASAEFDFSRSPVLGDSGSFTFTPRSTGVVAYLYDFDNGDQQRVEAKADGSATLPYTAATPGYITLTVYSVTEDGTLSNESQDSFIVTDTHPMVYSDSGTSWPDGGGVGVPVNVSMSSNLAGVTGFVYTYDGGPEKTNTDGAYVDVAVVPTHAGDASFTARAVLADGTYSPPTTIIIHVTSGPLVSSKGPFSDSPVLGRPATFTFQPALPGVVSYRYSWPYSDDVQTVAADADGVATVTWTPTSTSYQTMTVTSVGDDGTLSDERTFAFEVQDPGVSVDASWYPWGPTGGMGVPGRIGFYGTTSYATTKYLWHVNDGPVQEVAPVPELVTYVPYTPDRVGESTVHVQRVFTDGTLGPVVDYTFQVGTQPQIESDVYVWNGWEGGPGVPGTFRFSGGMPGVVSWDYRFANYDTGEQSAQGTVAADRTGAGQVVFTPTVWNQYSITVTGHSADGTATDSRTLYFGVSPG